MQGLKILQEKREAVSLRRSIAAKIADRISLKGWIIASDGFFDGIDIDYINLVKKGSQELYEVYGCCTVGDYFTDVGSFNQVKTIFFKAIMDTDINIISLKEV